MGQKETTMTKPDEKRVLEEKESAEDVKLSKETLEDLDATDEGAADGVKGGMKQTNAYAYC
jgi:hypothetical protein